MKVEVFILERQRIDQKRRRDGREAMGNEEREKREKGKGEKRELRKGAERG